MFIIDYILNVGISTSVLVRQLESMDTDKDGIITIRELIALFRKVRA